MALMSDARRLTEECDRRAMRSGVGKTYSQISSRQVLTSSRQQYEYAFIGIALLWVRPPRLRPTPTGTGDGMDGKDEVGNWGSSRGSSKRRLFGRLPRATVCKRHQDTRTGVAEGAIGDGKTGAMGDLGASGGLWGPLGPVGGASAVEWPGRDGLVRTGGGDGNHGMEDIAVRLTGG